MKHSKETLDQLLLCLVEPPVLAYPDHNKEFILHADTSGKGLGVGLFQYQKAGLKVTSYATGSLKPAEKEYHSSKHLGVNTDNNFVTCIMNTGRLTATKPKMGKGTSRILFSLLYKPGKQNVIA